MTSPRVVIGVIYYVEKAQLFVVYILYEEVTPYEYVFYFSSLFFGQIKFVPNSATVSISQRSGTPWVPI